MRLDVSKVLKGIDGRDMTDATGAPATLGAVAVIALTGNYADEPQLAGEEKFARYELALRMVRGGVVELTVDQLAKIKALIGKGLGVAAVGAAWSAIEAGSQEVPGQASDGGVG